MHCPNCGNESSLDQKFCRKCGFGLAAVGELLRAAEPTAEAAKLDRAQREALMVRQMFRWIAWGMIVLGIGVLMLVVNKSFDVGKFLNFLSSILLLSGTAMAAYGVISTIGKGARSSLKGADELKEFPAANTRELGEPIVSIPMSSVTERTTDLIGKRNERTPD